MMGDAWCIFVSFLLLYTKSMPPQAKKKEKLPGARLRSQIISKMKKQQQQQPTKNQKQINKQKTLKLHGISSFTANSLKQSS